MEKRGALLQIGYHMDQMWSREDSKGPWDISGSAAKDGKAVCKDLIAAAEKAGATDADVTEPGEDGPDWIKGKVSLGDMKLVCNRMQRMIDIKAVGAVGRVLDAGSSARRAPVTPSSTRIASRPTTRC